MQQFSNILFVSVGQDKTKTLAQLLEFMDVHCAKLGILTIYPLFPDTLKA